MGAANQSRRGIRATQFNSKRAISATSCQRAQLTMTSASSDTVKASNQYYEELPLPTDRQEAGKGDFRGSSAQNSETSGVLVKWAKAVLAWLTFVSKLAPCLLIGGLERG